MIKDLPTAEQFDEVAIDLLNVAWTLAADLTHNLELARQGWDDEAVDREITDDYWKAAQRPLATAISLVQQAMEFLLKARIAGVSPFLLLSDEWARGSDTRDIPFSEFKTIDANELIRVHNTVCTTRLDSTFAAFFNELRTLRNAAAHSLIANRRFTEREVFVSILKSVQFLLAPKTWVEIRQAYLHRDPIAITHSTDFSAARHAQDITVAVNSLTPSDALWHFQPRLSVLHPLPQGQGSASQIMSDSEFSRWKNECPTLVPQVGGTPQTCAGGDVSRAKVCGVPPTCGTEIYKRAILRREREQEQRRYGSSGNAITYFGFDKRAHAYCCPSCIRRCGDGEVGTGESEPRLAQLVEKTPECTQAKCALCGRAIEVTREACRHEGCPGNVIEKYTRVCMTCNCYQPGEEPNMDIDY